MMPNFYGEFDCKMDAKGRVKLPSSIIEQIEDEMGKGVQQFILHKDPSGYLNLYPRDYFENVVSQPIRELSKHKESEKEIQRNFFRNTILIKLDDSQRILLKKPLIDFCKIKKVVVLSSVGTHFELWSKEVHDKIVGQTSEDEIKQKHEDRLGHEPAVSPENENKD